MSWFDSQEQQNPHVLWSKVRFTRNLAATRFAFGRDASEYEKFSRRLGEIMSKNGFHEDIFPKGVCAEVCALAEKQFVDYSFASYPYDRALYFNEPCSLTIYSGGDFHLNIQSLLAGASLCEAYKIASEAEELLDGEFEFAYSDKLGYLASDISRCGSGVELSSALFLPTARHGTRLGSLQREAMAHGASLSPFLAQYDNAGDIYIISQIPDRTADEKKAVLDFSRLVGKIVEDEIINQRIIFANRSTIICDKAWRALGTLASARSIEEDELFSLLSRIRLALSLESTKNDSPHISLPTLSTLLANCLGGAVATSDGAPCKTLDDCRIKRADIVRRSILPLCSEMIKTAI